MNRQRRLVLLSASTWLVFASLSASPGVTSAQIQESTVQLRASKAVVPKVEFVSPIGQKIAIAPQAFEQRTVWSSQDQSVVDLLSKSGLALDVATVKSIRTLNPAIRPDGVVPAGAKVTYFVPKFDPNKPAPGGAKASFNMGSLARYSVKPELDEARDVRQRTANLKVAQYERQVDFLAHKSVVRNIETTADLVERKADKMSAKDLALSRYYLTAANAKAAALTFGAGQTVTGAQVEALKVAAQPVQSMQIILRDTDSPFQYRSVVVQVKDVQGAPASEPLRVYVLPSGLVADPSTFSDKDIEQYLIDLSFEKLTTPSQSLVAQADMRVWIGPDHRFAEMARLVKKGEPIRFTRLDAASPGAQAAQIEFVAPADIVRP